jgi:hypothetical protein
LAGDIIPSDEEKNATYGRVTKVPRGMIKSVETIEKPHTEEK